MTLAPPGRDHWDKMGMRPALEALRSEAGEAMVLQNNYFIEEILPNAILRKLSNEEMAQYRRPFAERLNTRTGWGQAMCPSCS
jgi:haloalkane dehalogenase